MEYAETGSIYSKFYFNIGKNRMKKILKYTGIIVLMLIIPAALAFVPIGNNIILHKHTNELKKFKLNADYKVAAVDSECGKLTGNGNGMQYFSALLIHSKEALKEY